ncbi:MAG: hypothetical protein ASARMPREDX12_008932 [Alectoria sarmentosa]|nr:MAG: hypothetical protein ASARMPREDX12_008932 [Alectoria sarmentosa]
MSTAPQLTARDVNLLAIAFQSLKDDSTLQIDYAKFAELAGYKTAASANACFLVVKKKLLGGASVSNAAAPPPKKVKAKAAYPENEEDDEATPIKAPPKKRGKTIKIEPVDAEGGDADTEVTPTAESPKKGRAKKSAGPSNADANGDTATKATTNGDATNDSAATDVTTATPKRKRGPNKPKDPNATPAKRAKKGANAGATTGADDSTAANAQLPGNETAARTNGEGSIFGGDANVKEEEEQEDKGDGRLFNAEEQKMADDVLFDIYPAEEDVA